jgi:hypothetical protein
VNKLPISVCVISGAEARRIGLALASVAEWTSEIIVVLNEEVSDGTDQIAASYGARVFREAWKGHIAQKNSALEKAAQPWILGLDADEAVSGELRDEILALQAPFSNCAAYSFPRCTFYFGRWIRHGDWYPDRCARLWLRGKARWAGIDPHDCLRVDGATGKLRHDLLHYTAESFDQQLGKALRYADDFARHCAATQRRIRTSDLILRPGWRFVRSYFLKLGFLDGWQGLSISSVTAFYTFLRYAKAREALLKTP